MKVETKLKYMEKARDLIADKDNWCQEHNALDKDGDPTNPKDRDAMRFCAMGAVTKAVRSNMNPETLLSLLDAETPFHDITHFNDMTETSHTHRRVVGAFNRAIKKLRKQL